MARKFNYVEVQMSLVSSETISEEDVREVIGKLARYLDESYRMLGGNGLRLPTLQADYLKGIEAERGSSDQIMHLTVRLTAREKGDPASFLYRLQEYIDSPEFQDWINNWDP